MIVKLYPIPRHCRPDHAQQGIVLLTVLWILVLLAVIVGQFCHSMRTELNITRNLRDETTGYYLARAGINLAIFKLINGSAPDIFIPSSPIEGDGPAWRINQEIPPFSFGNGKIQVKIDNESGKINISEADHLILKTLFRSFTLPGEQVDSIVDSLLDWRDKDNFHRHNGAENDYYQSLPQPYNATNGPFHSIEELLLVKGITRELWRSGLQRMVTVQGVTSANDSALQATAAGEEGTWKINVNAASPEVLRCLPGMTPEILQAISTYRQKMDFLSPKEFRSLIGEAINNKIWPYISVQNSSFYTIRATGVPEGAQAGTSIEALVRLDPRLNTVRVVRWVDYLEPGKETAGTGDAPETRQN